jgi:hypothetical protein
LAGGGAARFFAVPAGTGGLYVRSVRGALGADGGGRGARGSGDAADFGGSAGLSSGVPHTSVRSLLPVGLRGSPRGCAAGGGAGAAMGAGFGAAAGGTGAGSGAVPRVVAGGGGLASLNIGIGGATGRFVRRGSGAELLCPCGAFDGEGSGDAEGVVLFFAGAVLVLVGLVASGGGFFWKIREKTLI